MDHSPVADQRRIKLLQQSSDEGTDGDHRSACGSINERQHESDDEYDEGGMNINHMPRKLREQVQALMKMGKDRKSILDETLGSNSEFDKTMSNMGKTFNFMNDFNKELEDP